jgi:hypothetical protein
MIDCFALAGRFVELGGLVLRGIVYQRRALKFVTV